MNRIGFALLLLSALIHSGFAVVEIGFWTHPAIYGRLTHKTPESSKRQHFNLADAYVAAPIVANAGIYNAILAAGLFWGLTVRKQGKPIRLFFLWCAVIAGLFGSITLWSIAPVLLQSAIGLSAIFAISRSRPSPEWEMGHEYPPADEQIDIAEVVRLSSFLQSKANSKPLRGQHAKLTGATRAKLIVETPTDPRLCWGIFREPNRTYDVLIRFSNGVGRVQSDSQKDARGMSIKVLGVDGPRCLIGEEDQTVQDFVMINFPAFPVKNAEEYVAFLAWRVPFTGLASGNKIADLLFFVPWRIWQFVSVGKKIQRLTNSVLDETYWSMSPYRLGPSAVKFSVAPSHAVSPATTEGASRSTDFLAQELRERVHESKIVMSFRIQFQSDPYRTPVEDPTVIWNEKLVPPIEVARIEIEKGALDNNELNVALESQVERLAFNPWHSLEDHRPLGGINRLRKAVYQASVRARRAK